MVRSGVRKLWASNHHSLMVFSSTILFLLFFLMASTNVSDNILPRDEQHRVDYFKQRTQLYEKMSRDLFEHGAAFLAGGETSQSLSISELFTIKNGTVTPVLKAADPSVRATVLHLSPEFADPIAQTVKKVFLPHFDGAAWFQTANLYHFSMFHASHHIESVFATAEEVDAEARAVEDVAKRLCPLRIRLERVVLTSTGVLLGCWQVINGTDPAIIRSELRNALPRAPKKQLYNSFMLHTSLARLLGYPKNMKEMHTSNDLLVFFRELIAFINKKLQGFEATISEIWFVEEFDILALALDGRIKQHKFPLNCVIS